MSDHSELTDDLVARLQKESADFYFTPGSITGELLMEAGDEIAALRAKLARNRDEFIAERDAALALLREARICCGPLWTFPPPDLRRDISARIHAYLSSHPQESQP